jgi:hypothetical protein
MYDAVAWNDVAQAVVHFRGVQLVGEHECVALFVYNDRNEFRPLGQNGRGRLCFESRVLLLHWIYDESVLCDALQLGRYMPKHVAEYVDLHFMHMLQHDTSIGLYLPRHCKLKKKRNMKSSMALTYSKHAKYSTMCTMCNGLVSGPPPRQMTEDPSKVRTSPSIGLMMRLSCDASICTSSAISAVKITTIASSMRLLI